MSGVRAGVVTRNSRRDGLDHYTHRAEGPQSNEIQHHVSRCQQVLETFCNGNPKVFLWNEETNHTTIQLVPELSSRRVRESVQQTKYHGGRRGSTA